MIRIRVYDKVNKAIASFAPGTGEGGKFLFWQPQVLETLCFDCYMQSSNFDFNLPIDNYELSIIPEGEKF